jgi:hypothetical protein
LAVAPPLVLDKVPERLGKLETAKEYKLALQAACQAKQWQQTLSYNSLSSNLAGCSPTWHASKQLCAHARARVRWMRSGGS